MDIASPYLFELRPHGNDKKTHAGVLEFIADEGNVHLPAWVSGSAGTRWYDFSLTSSLLDIFR